MEEQTFGKGIWSDRKEHHKDAQWLKDFKKQADGQDKIDITKDDDSIKKGAKFRKLLVLTMSKVTGVFAGLSRLWGGPRLADKRTNRAYTKGQGQGKYCKQLSTCYMLTLSMEVIGRYIGR